MKSFIFGDITQVFSVLFAACFTLVSCLPYSLTLKMEMTCSSERSQKTEVFIWKNILVSSMKSSECRFYLPAMLKIEYSKLILTM
jgi:hypothetical protein